MAQDWFRCWLNHCCILCHELFRFRVPSCGVSSRSCGFRVPFRALSEVSEHILLMRIAQLLNRTQTLGMYTWVTNFTYDELWTRYIYIQMASLLHRRKRVCISVKNFTYDESRIAHMMSHELNSVHADGAITASAGAESSIYIWVTNFAYDESRIQYVYMQMAQLLDRMERNPSEKIRWEQFVEVVPYPDLLVVTTCSSPVVHI